MQAIKTERISVGTGDKTREIAVEYRSGKNPSQIPGPNPGIVWLGGYRSDMGGTKAIMLDKWAAEQGNACCRHDYSGHGDSGGQFSDGTISRWLEESLAVFDAKCAGPQILIGSSMGAWIALRMVQELVKRGEQDRLHALLLIAPAPDFTHELMLPNLTDEQRTQLDEQGYMEEPSDYSDEPNIFTKAIFDDGDKNRVMTGTIETHCPVNIIQGMQDPDVPYQHALKLVNFLPSEQVTMTLVKDGDHRLSRDEDIELILRITAQLSKAQ